MIIIVSGSIGQSGLGGQAWVNMQYLLGLQRLGHEVYYVEDCGETSSVYHWETRVWTLELDYPAQYIGECLAPVGFGRRWIYRAGDETRGMAWSEFADVCARADLIVFRALFPSIWRPEYELPRRRIFIDVDPGYTQIAIANGTSHLADALDHCERLFTVGQLVGRSGCSVPTNGREWLPTLSPVFLPEWPVVVSDAESPFTALMRWSGFRDAHYGGKSYGQKNREFPLVMDLPERTRQRLLLAIIGDAEIGSHGWETVSGEDVSRTTEGYRRFIQQSRAEFGIAKEGYVQLHSGWFSDRSACYLASGKPILVQETGAKEALSIEAGVVTFATLDEAVTGIERINHDYEHHCLAARALAETLFSTDVVLPQLLEQSDV